MSKKAIGITIVLILIVGLFVFKTMDYKTEGIVNESIKVANSSVPVETIKVSNKQTEIYKDYVGVVDPVLKKDISFDTVEEIKKVYVKQGMLINQGDPVLQIEVANSDEDLIDDLFDQLDKRNDAYDEKEDAKDEFEDADEDDDDYDDLKDDYEYLEAVYEVEKDEYESLRVECLEYFMFCPMDGYVEQVIVKNGAYAYPHQKIVSLGFEENGVVVGVLAHAVSKIKEGDRIKIEANDMVIDGEIFDIADLPNEGTNIYEVSISYDTEKYDLQAGDIVSVKLKSENKTGITIPINIILNDGNDYVYVVNDNTAVKKYIQIEDVINDFALISGVEPRDEIVSKGMKNIQDGSSLNIVDVQ